MSAASSYLAAASHRTNLDVLINTRVTRLLPASSHSRLPDFRKVEIVQSREGTRSVIVARKEVILSAGSINSPQILQLSGIGPREVLEPLGIEVVVESKDVGNQLGDHPFLPLYFSINSNMTFDGALRSPSATAGQTELWRSGKGLFVDPVASTIGFMRLPRNNTILKRFSDPSCGSGCPQQELLFTDGFAALSVEPAPPNGSYMTLGAVVVSPTSGRPLYSA